MKRKAAACIGIFCSIIAGTFIADDFCKTRQQTEADNWERFFLGAEYAEDKLSAAESIQTPFQPREYIRIVYREKSSGTRVRNSFFCGNQRFPLM